MTHYQSIKASAERLGVTTRKDFEGSQPGYWILNKDGTGVWNDGNFATSLAELESLIAQYEIEQTAYIIQHCDPLGVPHSWIAEIADEPHPFLGFCTYISKAKRFETQEEAERAAQDLTAWFETRGGGQHGVSVTLAPECRPSNVTPMHRAQTRPDKETGQ